jgi:2-keto-4-pentenoate hydratase/2-oxohepta-3-ene-1,7-dioic acid hydratase in catechol pathway
MRFLAYSDQGTEGLAAAAPDGRFHGLLSTDAAFPGPLSRLVAAGAEALQDAGRRLLQGAVVDPDAVTVLPPLPAPGKIVCVGLNYVDHSIESGFVPPAFPTIFTRFASTLVGHGAPILRPALSDQLDYEGEMVAVIGRGGRHIAKDAALDHVIGYSVFNEASVRDYQTKGPQWTLGKNFDNTGGFGPVFVTADELPPGGKGLRLQTRLNGQVVQTASTDDMIFDVATIIAFITEAITLAPGDIIITGTPAGVGMARKPQLFMKPGDVCEVELERVGLLRNPIQAEAPLGGQQAA